mmetsp:Transcript_1045/g.1644  ORF Transcript_1045/g.1644 Transcript_1045/m.1644 type:complete len:136 (+) Transcript_1045:1373-1780(+)
METGPFSIESAQVLPEVSPLSSEVNVEMTWSTSKELASATWEVYYVVDTVRNRQTINLLVLGPFGYSCGSHSLKVTVPSIDPESLNLSKSQAMNAGLLVFELKENEESLVAVNMVVQVVQKGDELLKTVFSPVEQ